MSSNLLNLLNIPFGKWLIDWLNPPLSNGEIPDFIPKPPDKQPIDNITNNNFQYNTSNNVYYSPKNFYTINVTNIGVSGGNDLPEMPPRLLPEDIPDATPTDPVNKPILSLKESFAKKKFGRLLYTPIGDTTENIVIIDAEQYLKKYESEVKLAGEEYEKWLKTSFVTPDFNPDKPPKNENSWEQGCALVNSFDNKLDIQPGIKTITYFRQFYAESSKTVLQFPVTGIIPKKYTFKVEKVNVKEIEIKDQNIEAIGPNVLNNKLGTFLFPFALPTYLLNIQSDKPTIENGELTQINNLMELIKWSILNFDVLIGEFPLKMEIDDVNPLNKDESEKVKMKIPNIAECLAELYGLATIATQNSNTSLALTTNLIPEILGIKNLAIVNQDFIKAITSFLGFKIGTRKIEFKTNFNPDKPKNWEELITPGRDVYIPGVENKSEETIMTYLINLMYVASLQKEALLTKAKDLPNNELIKEIMKAKNKKDIDIDMDTNPDDPDLSDKDKEWIEFLKHINNPETSFNADSNKKTPFKPKVDKHKKL